MEALGIDLTSFLFQLGNFVVLLVILTWLLHKPLRKLLEDRQRTIAEGLANAEKARKQLEDAVMEQKKLIEAAEMQGRQLLEEVRARGKELETELHELAQAKAEQLLAHTRLELEHEKQRLQAELHSEVATLVVLATQKVLEQKTTSPEKQEQIKSLVNEMRS